MAALTVSDTNMKQCGRPVAAGRKASRSRVPSGATEVLPGRQDLLGAKRIFWRAVVEVRTVLGDDEVTIVTDNT
jgi:hypothetical protein